MGISSQTLIKEKNLLQKSFDDLSGKIQAFEKETQILRNNLNAVHGALQQVNKLIAADDNFDKVITNGTSELPSDKPFPNSKAAKALEIKQKEEAKLLNEGDKWKKISMIF